MTQPPPPPSPMPVEIPDAFFTALPGAPTLPHRNPNKTSVPSHEIKAMVLYDLIIDDILTHQGCTITDTAARLGKKPMTISLVVRSDFFKARWLQRRAKYNEDLNFRLQGKLAAVVEASLDKTLDVLKTKANIPLPDLNNLNASLLDRMGYGPSRSGPGVTVQVQQNNMPAPASAPVVSAEGLAKAREHLRTLEAVNAASGHAPGNTLREPPRSGSASGVGPVVEGEVLSKEESR